MPPDVAGSQAQPAGTTVPFQLEMSQYNALLLAIQQGYCPITLVQGVDIILYLPPYLPKYCIPEI
jgi:hypothetical protein